MKIQLSVAIMGVPQRQKHIQETLERLNYPCRVFIDPHPGHRNWENAQRAYLGYAPGATHHLVLQDDLALCVDFIPTVYKMLEALPGAVISLYNQTPGVDLNTPQRWVKTNAVSGAAVVAPIQLHLRWIRWARKNIDNKYPWEDKRMSFYLETFAIPVYSPIPSPVQHLGAKESTLGLTSAEKVSLCYQGDDVPLAGIDWTEGIETPFEYDYLDRRDGYIYKYAKTLVEWDGNTPRE